MIQLNFSTITPLHIGNGEELARNIDYLISNNQFLRLDPFKLSSYLAKKKAFDFDRLYNLKQIESVIKRYSTEIYPSECKYIIDAEAKMIDYLKQPGAEGKHFVKEFINSNGMFYIPASSIKGTLLTILGLDNLGISLRNGSNNQKVVFYDSDYLNQDDFIVLKTNPGRPSINLICLKKGKQFQLKMMKKGELDLNELKEKLSTYSKLQITKAKEKIRLYKSKIINRPNGADIMLEAIDNILSEKLNDQEYLINLGFGGGSWFKLFSSADPPQFQNIKTKNKEYAHTAFTTSSENNENLGWCKLKFKEN
jgi:CRISPR/Cas system CSM-associated protein Csm5 (group 7 of RAMP superfamily)